MANISKPFKIENFNIFLIPDIEPDMFNLYKSNMYTPYAPYDFISHPSELDDSIKDIVDYKNYANFIYLIGNIIRNTKLESKLENGRNVLDRSEFIIYYNHDYTLSEYNHDYNHYKYREYKNGKSINGWKQNTIKNVRCDIEFTLNKPSEELLKFIESNYKEMPQIQLFIEVLTHPDIKTIKIKYYFMKKSNNIYLFTINKLPSTLNFEFIIEKPDGYNYDIKTDKTDKLVIYRMEPRSLRSLQAHSNAAELETTKGRTSKVNKQNKPKKSKKFFSRIANLFRGKQSRNTTSSNA